jgi:hypothetical protein
MLDRGLITFSQAGAASPAKIAEFDVHGGRAVVAAILDGCRQFRPPSWKPVSLPSKLSKWKA